MVRHQGSKINHQSLKNRFKGKSFTTIEKKIRRKWLLICGNLSMSIETRKQFREQKWINLMLSSRRLQLRFILFATVFAIFCLYYSKEFRFSVSTSTFLKNSSNTTTEKLKKVPKFYKLLNWEKRESEKKLNNIEDLRRVNLNVS